jgi:DNA invertase Pin-like site-specific DNA recombinase
VSERLCVGYARVSTAQQVDGASPEVQRQEIENWVRYESTRGTPMRLIKIYQDLGISGASNTRPQFQQLLEDARAGQFNTVVVSRFSRFARSLSIMVHALEELEKSNVRFVSLHERYDSGDTSPAGTLIRNILISLAEFEREQIRETLYAGKFHRWAAKKIWVGGVPYGYSFNKELGQLEPIPEKLEIYKQMVSFYLDQNMSFDQILDRLAEMGVKCGKRPFSKPVLGNILKSTVYKGYYIGHQYGYSKVTTRKGQEVIRRDKKKLNPETKWIRWECEPAITEQRWDAIQTRIQGNRQKTRRRENLQGAWLRDSLQCAICNSPIKPKSPAKNDQAVTFYRCYWAKAPASELKREGRKRCPLPTISAEALHEDIWARVCARLLMFRGPKSQLARLLTQDGSRSRLKELKAQLKTLQAQLTRKQNAVENLMMMVETGELSATQRETFIQRMGTAGEDAARLATQVQALQAEIGNIAERQQQAREAVAAMTQNEAETKKLVQMVVSASDENKYKLIREMISDAIQVDISENSESGWEVLPFYFSMFPASSLKQMVLDSTLDKSSNKLDTNESLVQLRWRFRPRSGRRRCGHASGR